MDRLVTEHVPLAQRIAGWWARRCPAALRSELESVALVGLVEAARRYEAELGDFASFAGARIRGAIRDELRRQMPAGQRRQDRGQMPPSATSSLDALLEENSTSAVEACACDAAEPEDLDDRRALAELGPLIRQLPRSERLVVRLVCLAGQTEAEVGRLLGISESGVCRVRARALERLRSWAVRCEP